MGLIHVIRDIPEYKGGALEADIPEQDYPILNARGWRKAKGKPSSKPVEPAPEKESEKPSGKPVEKTVFKGGTK